MVVTISITLSDNNGYIDTVVVNDVIDKNCFNYVDNENNDCKLCVYERGIVLYKQCDDHSLELDLNEGSYAKISTKEGDIKLDAKVVDFLINDDILVMRYIIEDVERKIEVSYRS